MYLIYIYWPKASLEIKSPGLVSSLSYQTLYQLSQRLILHKQHKLLNTCTQRFLMLWFGNQNFTASITLIAPKSEGTASWYPQWKSFTGEFQKTKNRNQHGLIKVFFFCDEDDRFLQNVIFPWEQVKFKLCVSNIICKSRAAICDWPFNPA